MSVAATLAGLDAFATRVERACGEIVGAAADIFKTQAQETAPVGDPENSTNPPGALKASMYVDGPFGGKGVYTAQMGPTVESINPGPGGTVLNYGRQREFGGDIFPTVAARLMFTSYGSVYGVPMVTQEGSHYLLRARLEAVPAVEAMVIAHLTAVVKGA